jgi:hypothetical protein
MSTFLVEVLDMLVSVSQSRVSHECEAAAVINNAKNKCNYFCVQF